MPQREFPSYLNGLSFQPAQGELRHSSQLRGRADAGDVAGDVLQPDEADGVLARVGDHGAAARVAAKAVEGRLEAAVFLDSEHLVGIRTEGFAVPQLPVDEGEHGDHSHHGVFVHEDRIGAAAPRRQPLEVGHGGLGGQ